MSTRIHIPADDVWQFFFDNKDRCRREMVEIAVNDETQYRVYLTDDNGYPMLAVCHSDDDIEYEEGAIDKDDCTDTVQRIFIRYLIPVDIGISGDGKKAFADFPADDIKVGNDEEDEGQERLDLIYEREDELTLSLCDFLAVVFNMDGAGGAELFNVISESEVSEILDDFLDYLNRDHGFTDIWRPTFIPDDETGEEFYTEYPYDPEAVLEDMELQTGK